MGTETECLRLAIVLNSSGVEPSIEEFITETADSESDRVILTGFGCIRLYLEVVGFKGELDREETVVVAVLSLVIDDCGDASLTEVVGTIIILVPMAGVIRDGVPVRGIGSYI